jgi:hypothetical protein
MPFIFSTNDMVTVPGQYVTPAKALREGKSHELLANFHTQQLHHFNLLIDEQQPLEPNPLHALSWEAQQTEPRQWGIQAT